MRNKRAIPLAAAAWFAVASPTLAENVDVFEETDMSQITPPTYVIPNYITNYSFEKQTYSQISATAVETIDDILTPEKVDRYDRDFSIGYSHSEDLQTADYDVRLLHFTGNMTEEDTEILSYHLMVSCEVINDSTLYKDLVDQFRGRSATNNAFNMNRHFLSGVCADYAGDGPKFAVAFMETKVSPATAHILNSMLETRLDLNENGSGATFFDNPYLFRAENNAENSCPVITIEGVPVCAMRLDENNDNISDPVEPSQG